MYLYGIDIFVIFDIIYFLFIFTPWAFVRLRRCFVLEALNRVCRGLKKQGQRF